MWNDWLTIGSITIHGYGVMTAVGIIMAYLVTEYRIKKAGLQFNKVFGLVIFCLIFGYLGSKVLYTVTIIPEIIKDPGIILRSLAEGWVVYGGILGGILGGFIWCKWQKLPGWKFFDVGLASVALAQAFGRLGCFFAGCCYGAPTNSPLSITFHHSEFGPNGIPLIPTQIYSCILDFLLFLFLLMMDKKQKEKRRSGIPTACYLILYSLGRFILEFFRGDAERGAVGTLSTSQFIAIFVVIVGIVVLVKRLKSEPEPEAEAVPEASVEETETKSE